MTNVGIAGVEKDGRRAGGFMTIVSSRSCAWVGAFVASDQGNVGSLPGRNRADVLPNPAEPSSVEADQETRLPAGRW
jgi:hypothetical protein